MANKAERYMEQELERQGLNLGDLAEKAHEKAHEKGYKSFSLEERKALHNPLLNRRLKGLQEEYSRFLTNLTGAMIKVATKLD